ncbi:UNVERIFIED_CONTAM: hypothetical protein RMT77_002583 [Armadillidium vulgare]
MSFRVFLFVFLSKLLCINADYGLASIFPELKIKSAGPSQQYNWVGYTPHFPKTVPRPLLRYRWQPYEDPTYTAFWVSEKDNEVGEYRENGGGVPHGFGAPKPSSIKGSLLDTFSGSVDSLETYQDHGIIEPGIPIGSSYEEPNAVLDYDDDFSSYGKANVEIEESYEIPSQVFEANPVIHTVEGDFGDTGGRYQEIAVGHQDSYIEAGTLIHSEQSAGESSYQPVANIDQQIVPLVKPPHSEPLPLENEGSFEAGAVIQDASTYQVLKRSPKESAEKLPKQPVETSQKETPKKSN